MRSRPLPLQWLLILFVFLGVATVYAESQTAVVNGISKLFVRRGPGMQFPPFASLSEGSIVEIQDVDGTWARINTANGQVGYVQRRYLETGKGETAPTATRAASTPTRAPATATRAATATRPAATATRALPTWTRPAATATPTRVPATATPPATRTREQPVEVDTPTPSPQHSRSTPATVVSAPSARHTLTPQATVTATPTVEETVAPVIGIDEDSAPPAPIASGTGSTAVDEGAIHRELQSLRIAVERLQRRLDEYSGVPSSSMLPTNGERQEPSSVSGGAVLLSLVGAAVGWFLGSSYTRKQERGRRSRIRF